MDTSTATQNLSMPRIGDKAPSFKAVTTQGEINFPDDYSGSWVILFSHPADFTPVCTSEFMTFASMEAKFAEAGWYVMVSTHETMLEMSMSNIVRIGV